MCFFSRSYVATVPTDPNVRKIQDGFMESTRAFAHGMLTLQVGAMKTIRTREKYYIYTYTFVLHMHLICVCIYIYTYTYIYI